MSAKKKQVVEVQEKLEDITECPICAETYREPKILPCIHTFCMICLQEAGLKTDKSPGDKMPCPICRTEFTVPEKGFAGLQRNFFMERLIEMKNILNPSSACVVCDACQEDSDLGAEAEIPSAEKYCCDCNQRLCRECCRHHRKYKATKNHKMLPLDGAQIDIPLNVKSHVCDKHENKPLDIYCSSCREAVCALCMYKSHKTHDTSPVVEVVTDFWRIIQENADSMMKYILDLKQKTTEKVDEKEMFARKVSDVESEIKKIKQNLQECIEKDCNSLLQQLDYMKQERIKESENQLCDIEAILASLESYQAYCTQVTTIGSDVDICRAVYNLNTRASELKQRYESLSLKPFPTTGIWLRKTECHYALYELGNNTIGKIEEIGDSQTVHAENNGSLIDKISSSLDEFIDILDKTSDEAKKDVCQSKQIEKILDHSGVCTEDKNDEKKHKGEEEQMNEVNGMEKQRSVEAFESSAIDELKEWTTYIDEISDKLKEIKRKITILVERDDEFWHELDFQRETVSMLKEENYELKCQAELIKSTKIKSDAEIIDLRKQVALLKSIAYDGNKTSIEKSTLQPKRELIFLQKITAVDVPDETRYKITGLSILDNELFVASTSDVVQVYDLRMLTFKRLWRVEKVTSIIDMKASGRNKYFYLLCSCISDGEFTKVRMLRCSAKGEVIEKWRLDSVYENVAQISVTDESNVLLTNGFANELIEYSPDGVLILVIPLKLEPYLYHVSHGIKLTSDHFLVCHSLQRVCMVDTDGNVLKYFGEVGRSDKVSNPIYLEMAADGNNLVADKFNQRLLILSCNLEFIQELNPHKSKYSFDQGMTESRPKKLLLDEANGRLFVAEDIWIVPGNGDYSKKQSCDQLSAFTFAMQ